MKGRSLFLITCLIVFSFSGVGYSAWTDGLNIKSLFATGNVHVVFKDPVIVDNELNSVNVDAGDDVLDIRGTVDTDSTVIVEYDIYNESSIPLMYHPDDETLPEGITLDQKETVIEPGAYLRGNKLTIEPGENEIILPFVQYDSRDSCGWKEELKICWNITIAEETVIPELDLLNEDVKTGDMPLDSVPKAEEPLENAPQAEDPDGAAPETIPPVTETTPEDDPVPDTDAIESSPANTPEGEPETSVVETQPKEPVINESSLDDNTESDEGSEENVTGGEK